VLTGDLNVADVEWIVQYRIQDPKAFWFHLDEPEQTVRDVSESVVRMVIGNRSVDEVLTVGRSRIESEAFETMQKVLNDYDSGLKVVAVQLQNVTPPEPVQGSFNDVNRAEQDREKLENEALAKKNREIPKARGEAKRAIDRAKGYEVDRVNAARGETSRFLALLGEYKKAPEVTRARIYLESMRKVMGSVDDLTVLEQGSGVLPILDVNKLSGGGK
jgi:membrane protease subunit HflK